ncbi:MAG TPA: flippase [Methanocorpusculum sp.]|nr:flippase [Methanocorpusculum sp.]
MKLPFVNLLMRLEPIRRQSLISFGFKLLVTLFGFFSTIFFSRVLGTELMGVYFLFLTYYSIFNLVGDGGFAVAAIKRISEGHDQNEYMTAYAVLHLILTIVSTLILLIVSPYITELTRYELVPWIIGALAAAVVFNTICTGVSGLNHQGIRNISTGVFDLARIFASVILVLLGYCKYGMIAGVIIGIICSGLVCIRYFTFKPTRFSGKHIKSLLGFSFWAFFISSSSLIISYSDTIFINYFLDTSSVGIYRVALRFTEVSTFITAAILSTLSPKISRWSVEGLMDKIGAVISRAFTFGLILAVPVAIGGIFLVDRLLYYFYGENFAAGATACIILLIYQIVYVFYAFIACALSNTNHVRKSFYGTIVALVLNIALNFILIPYLGINGAAVSSVISLIVNTLIVGLLLRKYVPFTVDMRAILHIVAASCVMGLIVFVYTCFVPLTNVVVVLVPVCVGAVVYFVILLKLNKGIRNEIAGVVENFGLKWPKWL